MTEEQITKKILAWLLENKWKILTYDFPQSGTGKYLHPNSNVREDSTKNHKAFIPDIVAVKNGTAVFFENKNRFYLDDFIKIQNIKNENIYSEAITQLLKNDNIRATYYGIAGLKSEHFIKKAMEYQSYVDFIVLVDDGVEFLLNGFEL